MAVDGTHLPFRPDTKTSAADYRNYKGWHSILAVAFVNSFHLFVDADVGAGKLWASACRARVSTALPCVLTCMYYVNRAAGRSGDNTVLTHSFLMGEINKDPVKWLGVDGCIAAGNTTSASLHPCVYTLYVHS